MRFCILLGLLAVTAAHPRRIRRGVIHDEAPQIDKIDGLIGESSHQHHIQHEHAKSHQSIKFEHYHPVPVYVKKEHSHLLKHPLEKGKFEHTLKQVHPQHEHTIGGGLVLEDHRFDTETAGFHDHSDDLSQIITIPEELKGWEGAGAEHAEFAAKPEEPVHYEYQPQEYSHDHSG